jgi:hypothetical protein
MSVYVIPDSLDRGYIGRNFLHILTHAGQGLLPSIVI